MEWFATVPNGMADLLALELKKLGAVDVTEARAGVHFEGAIETAYRALLWSRLANRILLPLATFPADSPDALYEGARHIDWSEHLEPTRTIAVDANVSGSKITHSHYAELRIKDAVVDYFQDKFGSRPSVDTARPDIRINGYIHRDTASLYIDLSGTSLHRRNYRTAAGEAPLKENLAAAILLRSDWPEIAAGGGAFVDLMCGSGTLCIEAALIAADIAPGLGRDYFGVTAWRGHRQSIWHGILDEAKQRRTAGLERLPAIMGFDRDRRVLNIARENAVRAGLGSRISFAYQDLFDFRHDFPDHGLMATNPPYGRRMAETGELPALYRALGQVVKQHMRGWHAAVFTEQQSLGKELAIRADKLHTLYNGAVACKLIHFNVAEQNFFADPRLPRRIDPEHWTEQAVMFANRLEKNRKQVEKWAARESVSCYRVYDADLPDFSAAIDCYHTVDDEAPFIVIQEYEAPKTIDPDKVKRRTSELVSVIKAAYSSPDDHLFYKTRARQRGDAQYERLSKTAGFHLTMEGAARLRVNFEDFIDTGLFLDHRPLRLRLYEEAKHKDFLNLFCYTAAATVHAALGGASSTTSVDMSKTFLDWAERNFDANAITGKAHRLVRADCLAWIESAPAESWDLIFLDPPTFSNSKRMKETFDVQADHVHLIDKAMRLLREDGTLYFSTNLRNFHLDPSLGERFTLEAFATIPFDFRRRQNIHHCWKLTRLPK